MNFTLTILSWYAQNKRNLPWRNTKDPYKIWISEIILQQTRVDQGMDYYHKFIKFFPKVIDLANASEDTVLKLWQGLGYYSRARNLHASAKIIAFEMDAKFPESYIEILKLKGIGDYTASAISSFCFNEKQAVVDGNVYRVLSRYFGVDLPIDSSEGKKYFKNLAIECLFENDPGQYNQAIMEFGAMACKPQNPDCSLCPLQNSCIAFNTNKVAELPVKAKKIKQRNRYFNYLVIQNKDRFYIHKRDKKDIWQALYEFLLIETEKQLQIDELLKTSEWNLIFKNSKAQILNQTPLYIHKLSHQTINAVFYHVEIMEDLDCQFDLILKEHLESIAFPRLIENYMNDYLLKRLV